mmetsp:Transcript_91671/g.238944  ORF Transcript_91671/g.238944 Transcript_91671/m.238944 type:complete len:301 (-) Transcript_91671:680-1582(-)
MNSPSGIGELGLHRDAALPAHGLLFLRLGLVVLLLLLLLDLRLRLEHQGEIGRVLQLHVLHCLPDLLGPGLVVGPQEVADLVLAQRTGGGGRPCFRAAGAATLLPPALHQAIEHLPHARRLCQVHGRVPASIDQRLVRASAGQQEHHGQVAAVGGQVQRAVAAVVWCVGALRPVALGQVLQEILHERGRPLQGRPVEDAPSTIVHRGVVCPDGQQVHDHAVRARAGRLHEQRRAVPLRVPPVEVCPRLERQFDCREGLLREQGEQLRVLYVGVLLARVDQEPVEQRLQTVHRAPQPLGGA